MRATTLLMTCSLLVLACAEPSDSRDPSPSPTVHASKTDSVAAKVDAEPAPSPAPNGAPDPADAALVNPSQDATQPEPEPEAEIESEQAPRDPLAPILPDGPEPGSPEADAELAELLEESTLTQEEFDAAFRDSKPKIAGDQFVFGPGDRTRKRPVITFGTPKIEGSKLAASEISALAKQHLRGFEGCLAVALTDDPSTKGSVTLRVRFDAKGKAESATIEGGAALGEPLRECLAAVADSWTLGDAAGATVGLSLTLASE